MPDHHVCRYPLWHRLVIGSLTLLWGFFAPVLLFRLVTSLPLAPVWSFVVMGGALVPGIVVVKALTAWRCQPPQKSRLPWVVYPALAVRLLPRDQR